MKHVLITGSNSGFGLETALLLANRGYYVIATMRDIEKKEEILKRAEKDNIPTSHFLFLTMDVTDVTSIQLAKEIIDKENIIIDILINNAGYCQGGFIDELEVEDYEKQFQTNVLGMISVTQTFLSHLKESKNGKIINVSSVSGIIGLPGMTPYCTSKFAVEGFSESLRLELLPHRISVSIIQPTSYKTKIWEKGLENIKEDQTNHFKQKLYQEATKSAKHGSEPKEIAHLIAKICLKTNPKLRYPVGKGAKSLSMIKKLFPWTWIERGAKWKLLKR